MVGGPAPNHELELDDEIVSAHLELPLCVEPPVAPLLQLIYRAT